MVGHRGVPAALSFHPPSRPEPGSDHAALELSEHTHHLPHGSPHRVGRIVGQHLARVHGEYQASGPPRLGQHRFLHRQLACETVKAQHYQSVSTARGDRAERLSEPLTALDANRPADALVPLDADQAMLPGLRPAPDRLLLDWRGRNRPRLDRSC